MYINLCLYVFIPSSIQSIILTASTLLVPLFVKISVLFFLMTYPGINITKPYIISKAYKSFGLLRRTFSETHCFQVTNRLYISLVRSTLLYCSSLWQPYQLHHIETLEKVQRRATKYILSDYTSNYKSRLIQLGILPLMYLFELADIMFFIKSVKYPSDKFNILDYVEFNTSSTRSAKQKLRHKQANTISHYELLFLLFAQIVEQLTHY